MKSNKKIYYTLIIILAIVIFSNNVFAEILSPWVSGTGSDTVLGLKKPAEQIWKTVTVVMQVIGFTGIIYVGIRYMFASADQKADAKKTFALLVIGIILVFGADIFVRVIYTITNDIL